MTFSKGENEYDLFLESSQNTMNKAPRKILKKLLSHSTIKMVNEKMKITLEKIRKLETELKKLYST